MHSGIALSWIIKQGCHIIRLNKNYVKLLNLVAAYLVFETDYFLFQNKFFIHSFIQQWCNKLNKTDHKDFNTLQIIQINAVIFQQ